MFTTSPDATEDEAERTHPLSIGAVAYHVIRVWPRRISGGLQAAHPSSACLLHKTPQKPAQPNGETSIPHVHLDGSHFSVRTRLQGCFFHERRCRHVR